jgi:hypothetical protein
MSLLSSRPCLNIFLGTRSLPRCRIDGGLIRLLSRSTPIRLARGAYYPSPSRFRTPRSHVVLYVSPVTMVVCRTTSFTYILLRGVLVSRS